MNDVEDGGSLLCLVRLEVSDKVPADRKGAGLEYLEMVPFSVAIHADGRRVRVHRSVDVTVDSIAEVDREESRAYRDFIDAAMPIVQAMLPTVRGERGLRDRAGGLLGALRRQPLTTVRDTLGPYDSLLRRWLPSDLTRGPVAAFAAHGGVGPTTPGGALFAMGDGSVRFLSMTINMPTFAQLANRHDGEMGPDQF